ncbi:MAG TPA: hypothetical protein VK887_06450 [Pseudonocardiaceae bacterium]|nr:hypothetical protein [Pseudonocardiaceae bacterium]
MATTAGTSQRISAAAVLENSSVALPHPVSQALSTTRRIGG